MHAKYIGLKYNCTFYVSSCVSVLQIALWWLSLAMTEWVCQFKIDLMPFGANQNLIYLIYFSICWLVDCAVQIIKGTVIFEYGCSNYNEKQHLSHKREK